MGVIRFARAQRLGPQVNRVLVSLSTQALAMFDGYQLWAGLAALF